MKWLIDHESLVKQQLTEDIERLTLQIRDDERSSDVNWLESQHEVILKKDSLINLRKMFERLAVHEKEMVGMKDRRKKENRAKVKYKSGKTNESTVADVDDDREKGEDDEFLIENYDDKCDEDDDEADDKKYPGVQVCSLFAS